MENRFLFDWLTFTSAIDTFESILVKIGLEDFSDGFCDDKPRNFYQKAKRLNGVTILSDNYEKQAFGVCVMMSGQGMRFFEEHSKKTLIDIFSLILNDGKEDLRNYCNTPFFMAGEEDERKECFNKKYVIEEKPIYNISRLDVAFDDFNNIIPFDMMIEKSENDEIISLSRSSAHALTSSWENAINGRTLNICSRKSIFYARVYDKKAERSVRDNLEFECTNWIRFEIELKKDSKSNAALSFIEKFVNEKVPFSKLFFGVVSNYMSFRDKGTDTNRSRWEVNEKWEKFLGDAEKISLASEYFETGLTKEQLEDNFTKFKNLIVSILLVTPISELFGIVYNVSISEKLPFKYKKIIDDFYANDNLMEFYQSIMAENHRKEEEFWNLPYYDPYKNYDPMDDIVNFIGIEDINILEEYPY